MSILEKIKGEKKILDIQETSTKYGPAYEATVLIGDKHKSCTLIQDKETGKWTELGDPKACQILRENLEKISTPIEGATSLEKMKNLPV